MSLMEKGIMSLKEELIYRLMIEKQSVTKVWFITQMSGFIKDMDKENN